MVTETVNELQAKVKKVKAQFEAQLEAHQLEVRVARPESNGRMAERQLEGAIKVFVE